MVYNLEYYLLHRDTSTYEHFYGIEEIWHGKEAMRDDVVLKMIDDLNEIQRLYEFNQNQIWKILKGF